MRSRLPGCDRTMNLLSLIAHDTEAEGSRVYLLMSWFTLIRVWCAQGLSARRETEVPVDGQPATSRSQTGCARIREAYERAIGCNPVTDAGFDVSITVIRMAFSELRAEG